MSKMSQNQSCKKSKTKVIEEGKVMHRLFQRTTIVRLFAIGLLLAGFASLASAVDGDGVVLINQAAALAGGITPGDKPGFPVTISRPGTYRLTSNLVVDDPTQDAILINEVTLGVNGEVTLDLNGFTITGPGTGAGIGIHGAPIGGFPSTSDVVVSNGYVTNFGSHGIQLDSGIRIEGVHSFGNGGEGIHVSNGNIILNNTVNNNGGNGIHIGNASTVIGNVVAVNGKQGIKEGYNGDPATGSLIKDNMITRNVGVGLDLAADSGYADNVLTSNNGGGPQVKGGVQIGQNLCGTGLCP
jgi:Right handed beta helix region